MARGHPDGAVVGVVRQITRVQPSMPAHQRPAPAPPPRCPAILWELEILQTQAKGLDFSRYETHSVSFGHSLIRSVIEEWSRKRRDAEERITPSRSLFWSCWPVAIVMRADEINAAFLPSLPVTRSEKLSAFSISAKQKYSYSVARILINHDTPLGFP